jgi:hypothetical protein
LSVQDLEFEPAWQDNDWGPLDRKKEATESDASGRFFIDVMDLHPFGAVVWATHAGHRAACVLLAPSREAWPREVTITLENAPEMRVLVLDGSGKPVPSAQIEHYGLVPENALRTEGEAVDNGGAEPRTTEPRARRLLVRTAITGADGTTVLGVFPGEQAVVATAGELRSEPWTGPARERLTLHLVPTFAVRGHVTLPDWSSLNYVGERRITFTTRDGGFSRPLHTIRAVEAGSFGPVVLPLLDTEGYCVRLEGSPVIPLEVVLPKPSPGAELTCNLDAELGLGVWLQVVDEENRIIPTAVGRARWQDSKDPEKWHFIERGAMPPGHPGAGLVGLYSVPRGVISVEASAPGYASTGSSPFSTDYYEEENQTPTIPLVLRKAARVTGRCLHAGRPVENFVVYTWRTSDRDGKTETSFFDREDGTFELDTAPAGDCWITACSAALPCAEAVQIQTNEGRTTEVDITLPMNLHGVGQIVDATTEEPLAGGRIQLFVPGDVLPIARWGDPIPAGADGVFALDGFRPGKNQLRAIVEGYSRKYIEREAAPGEQIDWGLIHMVRAQTLTVQLEDASGENRFEGIEISGNGAQPLRPLECPASGRVEFPNVSFGDYFLAIVEPDSTYTMLGVALVPGQDWTIRHRIAGPNHLSVEVKSEDPDVYAELSAVRVNYLSRYGQTVQRSVGPVTEANRRFELRGIDADSVQATVEDASLTTRAAATGTFRGGRLELVLTVGQRSFVVRVVDPRGAPIGDVSVDLADPQHPGSRLMGSTDGSGRCTFEGVAQGDMLISLRHGSRGRRLEVPIDTRAEEAEVVLDSSAVVRLRFHDEGLALRDVACTTLDSVGQAVEQGLSGPDGLFELDALTEGPYRLRAVRNDCWPIELTARASVEAPIRDVELRRLGDLELHLRAPGGLPVNGLELELTLEGESVPVSRWLADERVRSKGLTTGLDGVVRIEGLPRGTYRWNATLPDGSTVEGTVEVKAGTESKWPVVVGE